MRRNVKAQPLTHEVYEDAVYIQSMRRFISLRSVCGKRDLGLLGNKELSKNSWFGITGQSLLTAQVLHMAADDLPTRTWRLKLLILSKPYIKTRKQKHCKELKITKVLHRT